MKKNYLSKTAMSANPLAMTVAKKSWKNITTTWLLLLFTVFGFTDALGQGNTCALAVSVNVNTEYTAFSVTDNTVNDPTQGAVNGQTMQRDGWFSFVSNGTEASIRVETGNRNPMIFAYSGACGGLTLIGSVNAFTGTGGHTEVLNLTGLTNGVTYYVRVGNSTNNNMPLSSFHILTNDRCANAFMLTSNNSCTTINGSTLGATDNNETGDCTIGTEEAVWYSFVAVASTHVITVDGAVGIDPVLGVISACGSATTPTGGACIDATGDGGIETRTLTGLTIGNTYYIQVYDYYGVNTNNAFTICVTHTSPPTITSLGAASGCVGSSLVITGTNFTGATAVTIGGTAAASYVVNSATQITATIGTGTTGTIQVTTPGGTATSAATFTVYPLPANPGNPTSNSPQCNPPGVTLTRTGTPPAGVTWYWQTVAGGTSTANSGATFVATTGGTYYLRAQNNTTGCWSAGSGSVAITITPSLSAVAGTPAPTNAATGICYAGGSPLTSLTWNAVAGATSYDVYFGAGSLPGTAIANVATNSYTLGTLSASTTYYWQVVPRNACGATSGTPATWTFTTSNAPCVCVPTATFDDNTGITNVTFNTINNTTTGTAAYTNTGISTTVTGTNIYPLSVSVNTNGAYTVNVKAWIDWDNNGLFTDPGEEYNLGSATNGNPILSSLSPLNISIPNIVGTFKMRVRASYNTAPTPCGNQDYSEAEDYTIVVTAPPACTTPTAPTSLVLSAGTPSGTAINGSFTAAAPAPNSYLVVVSTSNIAPSISNGTTYTIGGNAGVGYTVVDTDTNTTFTAGGLNPSTTYYFYVYSMNYLCSGGPLYNATPLTGNLTTGATLPTYCNATTNTPSTRYIDDISFLGMLNGNIYNLNTGFTTTPAPGGYQDWTGLATKPRQAQGGGVNISFESNSRGTWKAWVDWNKDGDFLDPGELVYTSAGVAMITNTFGFIIPNGATPGDYRVRIRTYNAFGNYDPALNFCDDPAYEYYGDGANHFDSCTQFTSYSQFINAGCGGDNVTFTEYGETEDYLFTVVEMCEANIVTVTDGEICGPGAVNVSVTGTPGTTHYRWYSAETGGALLATTTTGS